MKLKNIILGAGSALVMACSVTSANAAVLFEGLGIWNAGASTTAYTMPETSFSFSFELPDDIGSSTTSAISNFSFGIGNTAVKTPVDLGAPISISFSDTDPSLFTLKLEKASFNFYGADLYSGGPFTTPQTTNFSVDAFSPSNAFSGTGSGYLQLTSVAAVPEPATWAIMILGLAGVGITLRKKRKIGFGAPVLA